MSFFRDMMKVFKKREITFLESYKESEDVYTFLFEKDRDVTWIAGQHGLFSIIHKKIKNPLKPFSVASAPSENVIRLTMGIGNEPSEYKKAMLELKPGMKVNMSGPVGTFHLQPNNPTVLVAGGIGITPFRSILKQLEAEGKRDGKPVHLLYMDSNKAYLYKDELDEISNHPSIDVTFLNSRDDLHREIDKLAASYKDDGKYLISGSKSMVESVSAYLQNKTISKRNIKKDVFFGY
ncbi:FAD-dependent oxidoreductase [Paenibacillus arenilitoris]|uniref:FAD-dependent oxidoreductase n=1 Tax=Paenibacillus arenilitoris TaxID=2772299 RepID=A0A927H6I6_9BACL|nr:FAD-dependent oxidoreductase [Paenibacillus arenilitoris]MBD2870020.1 FAD-dependent oxidoreductase [Paenibacillus arenilitoris]